MTDGGLGVVGRGCCGVFYMFRGGADLKGTTSTTRELVEASTPGPTVTGECGVGVVAGAAQEQATQAAAGREAAWELCGCDKQEGGREGEHGCPCG